MKQIFVALITSMAGICALAQFNSPDYTWFIDGNLCYRIISEEDATAGLSMPYSTAETPYAYKDMDQYLNSLPTLTVPATATDSKTGKEYKVVSIFNGAINSRTKLTELIVAEGITSIAGISDCLLLKDVELPETLKEIDGLYNLPALTRLDLPDGLETIKGMRGLPALEYIKLPDNLKEIGDQSLMNTGLKTLCIPASVKTVGFLSISDNANLERIDISGGELFQEGSISDCKSLTKIILPNTPFYTDWYTFSQIENMAELWIGTEPNANVAAICSQSFSGVNNLSAIYCTRLIPPEITEQNPMHHPLCFNSANNWKNITLYVPTGCKEAYSTAYCWKDMNIKEYNFSNGIAETGAEEQQAVQPIPGGLRLMAIGLHTLTIYTPDGAVALSTNLSQGETVSLDKGIYIVSCDGNASKIAIR